MTNTNQLTEAQFSACQDKIDDMIRSSRKDPTAKAAVAAISAEWEAAIALPQATAAQRDARRVPHRRVARPDVVES